ncbi:uncharacterized protein LOC143363463 [Halictus rubicundus]|uniref:uncharacterized protein LOC143363463 n=1 Tax=Halictus rubicundus TaxID=77578 RepID=UPI004035C4A8
MPPKKRRVVTTARAEDGVPRAKRSCVVNRDAEAVEDSQLVVPALADGQPPDQVRGGTPPRRPTAVAEGSGQDNHGNSVSRTSAAAQPNAESITREEDLGASLPTCEPNLLNSPSIFASSRCDANATDRLADAIMNTLRAVREASFGEGNSRLLHRLTSAKRLPKFSGDPIEWSNFKEAYLLSAELGGYSGRENVARLFEALEGEARASVSALLATASDANVIIQTLELQFGNKHTIAEKIGRDINNLPDLENGKGNMGQFAAKLRSYVIALKSLDLVGYLHSPDLVKTVANKLPSALRYAFNRYAAEAGTEKTTLEKLADYVYKEAELAAATSIFDTDTPSTSFSRKPQIQKRQSRSRPAATYITTFDSRSSDKGHTNNSGQTGRINKCAICSRTNHKTWECREFARETISRRWALVKKNKLCFKCLGKGHANKQCTVLVSGPRKSINTFALLDEGSTITLIERQLAQEIGAKGPRQKFALKGINDREAVTMVCEKTLCKEIVEHVNSTENVTLQSYDNAQPRMLLGQDQWQLISTREFREVSRYMLGISRSLLGWTIHGSAPTGQRVDAFSGVETTQSSSSRKGRDQDDEERLDELVKQYFELDNFGVNELKKTRSEHEHAETILKNTTRRINGSWEVGLLWKKRQVPNADSLTTARKRLFSLEKKLDRDPEYSSLYYQEMNRFIEKGYAKRVYEILNNERVWYLPHFGVRNVNKPGKIRLVFDAAAKSEGLSLNDQLETGPDLLQSLPGVLIRFRQESVAVKADIKDMFLRVKVRQEDRGAQRFLWRGKARDVEPHVYEMTSLIFGAKSSPCSAMYIKDENAKSFANQYPGAAKSIIKNSYMDDFLASRATVQEAACLVRDVEKINVNANFEMHGWVSNEERALIGTSNRELSRNGENPLCTHKGERVLGLFWDTRSDTLGFNMGIAKIPKDLLNGKKIPSKREYLRVVMSVFDPLGFLSRLMLMSKILMQEIWRSGIGWDDQIRVEEQKGWLSWVKRLRDAREIRLPRCLSPNGTHYTKADLHVFCDASLKAYAAAAYLRFEVENAPARVAFIMAKTRVAPLKPMSIPRLELQAALLASRLARTVQKELEIEISRRVFWSDSITVIRWIKSEPRTRQVFVANRLGEIGELTESSEWRWVPSKLNPADDATRWSDELLWANQRWFAGPDFLRQEESAWPVEKRLNEEEKQKIDTLEVRKEFAFVTEAVTNFLPQTGKYLGWPGLLAVARRVQRYVDRWRGQPRSEMTHETVNFAERYWFREIQATIFGQELEALRNERKIHKGSRIAKLQPFVDEHGIMRANGRVINVEGFVFNNNPIILDGKHPATRLLVAEYHRRFYHANHDSVINELRQEFYIVGLRSTFRSLISKCSICKRRRGKPRNPIMSALPAGRVAYRQRPFSHCGVDYFGPMLVKIGRRREKRWGVLFTCLTTRAVHLELAHSLSASSAIMALTRLAARRGFPLIIYSDNGTNFRGASKELRDAIATMKTDEFRNHALQKKIQWFFNPPDAPHMGGAWERLIKSVKIALNAILRDQAPSEEVLNTLMLEIEHSINSRPLTHVSVDPQDKEALTPNHFLIGTSSGEIRLGRYDAQTECPRRQWKIAQFFADAFWRRWLREYLPGLIPRSKWCHSEESLKNGDIVLIAERQAPRNSWKIGKIVEVYPGSDEVVRVAKVRTVQGEFVRPTRKLIKIAGCDGKLDS